MTKPEIDNEEELTYGEILANLSMNGELIIVIPMDKEEEIKVGLKNLKSRQNARMEKDGLPRAEEILQFSSTPSKEYEDCVNLRILLKKKGTITIKKMVIPDNTF